MNLKHLLRMQAGLILLALLALAGCSPAAQTETDSSESAPAYAGELRGAVITPPRDVDFSLMSTTGQEFSLSEHKGQTILLFFGYRTCPDFCPNTLTSMRHIYQDLNNPVDQVKVVFVTVDPDRDTLENLAQFVGMFNPNFIGLRGEGDTLQAVMDQFGVVARKRQVAESALSYLIDHTASIFLIGPDGRLQAQYLYGTDYKDIVHDLQIIMDAA